MNDLLLAKSNRLLHTHYADNSLPCSVDPARQFPFVSNYHLDLWTSLLDCILLSWLFFSCVGSSFSFLSPLFLFLFILPLIGSFWKTTCVWVASETETQICHLLPSTVQNLFRWTDIYSDACWHLVQHAKSGTQHPVPELSAFPQVLCLHWCISGTTKPLYL